MRGTENPPGSRVLAAPASIFRLGDLPVETIIDIFCHLDFGTLESVMLVNKRVRNIVKSYWPWILPDIIAREFAPIDGFLRVFNTSSNDLTRHDGGLSGQLRRAGDLPYLLNFCRAVKHWESEFQRQRFSAIPKHSRMLRAHELFRLRHALYTWWRFARCFHNGAPSDHPELHENGGCKHCVQPHLADVDVVEPCHFFQQLSSTELHELLDVWRTIWNAVSAEVCPSYGEVRFRSGGMLSPAEIDQLGWGRETYGDVSIIMRLPPEDVLHLLVYRHRYATKSSVIRFVEMRHRWSKENAEALGHAVHYVRKMRRLKRPYTRDFPANGFPTLYGGIVDYKRPKTEQLRVVHGADAGEL